MSREIPKEAEARVRREFERVLDEARPAYELHQLGRFTADEEAFIQQEVERMLYEPKVPNAGDAERRIVQRLKAMSEDSYWKNSEAAGKWMGEDNKNDSTKNIAWLCGKAAMAMHKWGEMLPDNPRHPGRYYVRHPLTFRYNKIDYTWFDQLLNCANTTQDWEVKWFAELMLGGLPESIADFKIECLFMLVKPDGGVDRVVRLENIKGEVSHGSFPGGGELLDAISFAAPEKFRAWSLGLGGFTFSANQTQLQMIHEDINRLSMGRHVIRVDSCGWYYLGDGLPGEKGFVVLKGLWFYDDAAVAPNGEILRPDEYGIIWHQCQGYYLMPKGREVPFQLGRPKMSPNLSILNCNLSYEGWTNKPQGETEEDCLRAFFREFCQRAYENFGSYDFWLSIGHVFSYYCAPELFKQYKIFPGGLSHGQTGSGKNKWVEWAVAVHGFMIDSGIAFNSASTSAVGLLMAAENYSNLPVAIDEFGKGDIDPNKLAVLHNVANRQLESKWIAEGGKQRVIKTSFLVGGECTVNDSAFRSRYLLVQASAELRKADHIQWFDTNKRFFFLLGRYILTRRADFVQHTIWFMDQWMKNPDIRNSREKYVYGMAWASWMALCSILQSHTADEVGTLKQHAIKSLNLAMDDVRAETNVNRFWTHVYAAFKAGAIPKSCFKVKEEKCSEEPPGMPEMGSWISYILYIDPNALLAALQLYLMRIGEKTLSRNDLRDQMKVMPYFLPTVWKDEQGNVRTLQARMGSGKDSSNTKVWGIKLDEHPDGLQKNATLDDYKKWRMDDSLGDPRKGPLFAIVAALTESQGGLA